MYDRGHAHRHCLGSHDVRELGMVRNTRIGTRGGDRRDVVFLDLPESFQEPSSAESNAAGTERIAGAANHLWYFAWTDDPCCNHSPTTLSRYRKVAVDIPTRRVSEGRIPTRRVSFEVSRFKVFNEATT